MNKMFIFRLPKIIFGRNSLEKIGEEAKEWGKKVFLVTTRKAMEGASESASLKFNPCSLTKRDLTYILKGAL